MNPIFRSIQSQDDAPLAAIIRKSLTDHQLAVPGTAELQKFYLSDAAKGQRLSYPLLAKIEAKAVELGYRQLYLESHHSLEAALHVYQKAGYRALCQPLLAAQHTTLDRFYVKTLEPQQPNQCNSTHGLDSTNGKTIE